MYVCMHMLVRTCSPVSVLAELCRTQHPHNGGSSAGESDGRRGGLWGCGLRKKGGNGV